jgi:hypothetical protein
VARKTTKTKKPTLEAKPETEDAVIEAADVETPAEEVEAIEPAPETPEEPSEEIVEAIEPDATLEETQTFTPQTTVVRKGGFVPMVLGGVVAAGSDLDLRCTYCLICQPLGCPRRAKTPWKHWRKSLKRRAKRLPP